MHWMLYRLLLNVAIRRGGGPRFPISKVAIKKGGAPRSPISKITIRKEGGTPFSNQQKSLREMRHARIIT